MAQRLERSPPAKVAWVRTLVCRILDIRGLRLLLVFNLVPSIFGPVPLQIPIHFLINLLI